MQHLAFGPGDGAVAGMATTVSKGQVQPQYNWCKVIGQPRHRSIYQVVL
jgi:hypothetical protein